ncbi:twin-arginine translocase TatA/TatE family subunit [Hymenobacter sp. APR13]|jgi:sec-independent protein translocase protein TatA|uniref:Sec-independent protein translocase subunit TatA/TatB n=1 Tax=Hymenobacter sp. APR13 TaxID=1356852 RepID=UPI0009005269|nr:twin-arginine translocase TatA/TatE family subunit [Hymenobacter sp. APR13]
MLLSLLILAIAPRTILFIVLILVLFFGAKRIPEMFRGMGQGIREFKAASKEPQPEYRDRPAAPGAPINPNAPINPTTTPNQPQA